MAEDSGADKGDTLKPGQDEPGSMDSLAIQVPSPGSTLEASQHGPSMFEVWKEYEQIAVHFNDLIMKLRVQALGGVAAIATVAGLVLEESGSGEMQWSLLAAAFLALILFWVALGILDFRYYTLLLYGAVEAILELERTGESHQRQNRLNLSEKLEETLENGFRWRRSLIGPILFYSLALCALFILFILSYRESCRERRVDNAPAATSSPLKPVPDRKSF